MKNKISYIVFLFLIIIRCKKEIPKTVHKLNMDGNFVKYNPETIKNFKYQKFGFTTTLKDNFLNTFAIRKMFCEAEMLMLNKYNQ